MFLRYQVLRPGAESVKSGVQWEFRWNNRFEGSAGILPITSEGNIVLVQTYRSAVGRVALEVPRGMRHKGEDPASCATREASEEAGIVFTPNSELVRVGVLHTDSAIMHQAPHLYIMTNVVVENSQALDETEAPHRVVSLSPAQIYERIERGEISDSFTHALLLHAIIRGIIPAPARQ